MSTPLLDLQQEQPPPVALEQEAYSSHSGHGSVGPVIAVLAVIAILGVVAGMIGRLCTGRRVMGYGQYDVEGWVERKCASCIDGTIEPQPPRPTNTTSANNPSAESVPVAIPIDTPEEPKQTERPPSN